MKVRVPATTANLGPGFDICGLALQLYNEYQLGEVNRVPHLADRAFVHYFRTQGKPVPPYGVRIIPAAIPFARGLGSSASLIVGGLVLANELDGGTLSKEALLVMANELEGHPDNVAPALLGGLVLSKVQGDRVVTQRFALSSRLHFHACIPNYPLETAKARQVLPQVLPRNQAVENTANCLMLVLHLINEDFAGLGAFFQDYVHEPYRAPLIAHYPMVKALQADSRVLGVFISGSGPTMMVLSDQSLLDTDVFQDPGLVDLRILDLQVDNQGYRILDSGE